MEDETKDDVKDIMITCNTCGFEVDYDTPCPNGCDTEVTEMVNRIFSEEEQELARANLEVNQYRTQCHFQRGNLLFYLHFPMTHQLEKQ